MPELRWILIGFGIVLLAGIYLWDRRGSSAAPDETLRRVRADPDLARREVTGVQDAPDDAPFAVPVDEMPAIGEPVVPITAVRPANRFLDPTGSETAAGEPDVTRETWRGRVEPTLGDGAATVELPVDPSAEPAEQAPTLSASDAPVPRRIERRKILSLRLAAGVTKFEGARLLETLQAESLQHGKYDVFHRLHTDGTGIFSIASMVEPGTFDVARMPQLQYPGITLFAQLPGPVPGMHALNELVACARRLQQALGGTLQDDRGVPLTVHRIERLRQEVREFERPPPGGARPGSVTYSTSP